MIVVGLINKGRQMMLLEDAPNFWTAIGALGSIAAAGGACYAAFQARATVGEMKSERLERRRLEEPELSIDGASVGTPQYIDIDAPSFVYHININNIKESKILDMKYVIAVFYNDKNGNNLLDVSLVVCERCYGQYPRTLHGSSTIFNAEFSQGTISKSVGIFVVKDVYLNEKRLIGQLNHMGEWDDAFESRFAHSRPVELVTMGSDGRKDSTAGITVLEENVKEDIMSSIVSEIKDEETLAFVNSFVKINKEPPWFIKIFQ